MICVLPWNLFSILGNTFGNASESEIQVALQAAMHPGDFLLLDVNCSEVPDAAFVEDELQLRHNLLPLAIAAGLGVSELTALGTVERSEAVNPRSLVPDTKTMLTCYRGPILESSQVEVAISELHYYNPSVLVRHLVKQLHLEQVTPPMVSEASALLLLRRL